MDLLIFSGFENCVPIVSEAARWMGSLCKMLPFSLSFA